MCFVILKKLTPYKCCHFFKWINSDLREVTCSSSYNQIRITKVSCLLLHSFLLHSTSALPYKSFSGENVTHVTFIVTVLKNFFLKFKLMLLSTCYVSNTILRDLYKLYHLNVTVLWDIYIIPIFRWGNGEFQRLTCSYHTGVTDNTIAI